MPLLRPTPPPPCSLPPRPQRGGPRARGRPLEPAALLVRAGTDAWRDAFSSLDDRVDAPPLPLRPLQKPVRVSIVRHGQSSWNAEGRIQGSSDTSVLTEKGRGQARATGVMVSGESFCELFVSPLQRAYDTARIVWGQRDGPVTVLTSLREVDLYSFQGLIKEEGKARFGSAYQAWKDDPANFLIDGHAPVRELWYRASLAWQSILATDSNHHCLVVAHNAVNQALICTALGLGPIAFRHILQSNAAVSVLSFAPGTSGATVATAESINQVATLPLLASGGTHLVLVCAAGTECASSVEESVVTALADAQADAVFCMREPSCTSLGQRLAKASGREPRAIQTAMHIGMPGEDLLEACEACWQELVGACPGSGGLVVAALEAAYVSSLACMCLGLSCWHGGRLRALPGSITIIEAALPGRPSQPGSGPSLKPLGILKCLNNTQHLASSRSSRSPVHLHAQPVSQY